MASFSRLTVAVSTQLLSEATLAEVAEACRRIDAETMFGTLEQIEQCSSDIIIGGLSAGRRVVPDEYLSLVSRRSADSSLVLICQEALVRSFVSLSQGRITLIAPNPDAETIYNRLRVLLAERGSAQGEGAEQAEPNWWAADSRGSAGSRLAGGDVSGSFTLAFDFGAGLEPASSFSSARTPDAARCLKQALSNTLSVGMGVLHYAPAAQEWLVSWPNVPGTLWLLSPLRLPPVSDLSGSHGGRGSTRLPAASGDIAIALSLPTPNDSTLELVRTLVAKATSGGPSVFDAVSASLRKDAWVGVVEVR